MKVKVLNDINDFALEVEEILENDAQTIILVPDNIRLDTLIENSNLDDRYLLKLRIANDFKIKAELKDKETNTFKKVNSIKEIIENITKDISYYQLQFDDISNEELAKVIQQFIYLSIPLDIVTKEELKYLMIYNNYKKNIEILKEKIKGIENAVKLYPSSKTIINTKKEIIQKLENIKSLIKKSEDRKLKIAVMATKKTGKSVIINSFLGEEYAPTSLTLPTPNAIIYEGWDKDYIELKIEANRNIKGYEKEIIKNFKTDNEIKEYIYKLFQQAKIDEESAHTLPDFYIKIPKKLDYIIIDTPGPDLAGAKHQIVAEKWLKQADAIIFASDFSKHLTNDEIKFLENVKSTLAKYNKFHSLIFTINKIDMRFQDSENKSIVKFIDFYKKRLEEMGYKGIPIMATSALEYFNSLEIKKILDKYGFDGDINNYRDLRDFFEELEDKDLSSEENTIVSFIENSLKNLKRFYKIKNPTLEQIRIYSGVPFLIERTEYVAKTKANIEIFKNIFGEIDAEFAILKNKFLIEEIKKLQHQKEAVLKDLDDMRKFFEKKRQEIFKSNKEKESLKKEIFDTLEACFLIDIKGRSISRIEAKIAKIKDEIIEKGEEREINIYEDIMKEVEYNIIQDEIINTIIEINKDKEKYVKYLEKTIQNINNDIQNMIKSKNFKKKYNLDITLPSLDPSLNQSEFEIDWDKIFNINYDASIKINDITKEEIRTRTVQKKVSDATLWNPFSWFRKKTINVEETYTVEVIDEEKIAEKLNSIKNNILQNLLKDIELGYYRAEKEMNKQLDTFNTKIQNEINEVIDTYEHIAKNIRNLLNDSAQDIEEKTKFLASITDQVEELFKKWMLIKEVK